MTRIHEEALTYQRGYQAGRKRALRDARLEYDRALAAAEQEDFRQRAALIVLQQMMLPGNAWGTSTDGVHAPYKTMAQYARGAFVFADQLVKLTSFSGLRAASGIVAATAGETACGLDERSEQSPTGEAGDAQ